VGRQARRLWPHYLYLKIGNPPSPILFPAGALTPRAAGQGREGERERLSEAPPCGAAKAAYPTAGADWSRREPRGTEGGRGFSARASRCCKPAERGGEARRLNGTAGERGRGRAVTGLPSSGWDACIAPRDSFSPRSVVSPQFASPGPPQRRLEPLSPWKTKPLDMSVGSTRTVVWYDTISHGKFLGTPPRCCDAGNEELLCTRCRCSSSSHLSRLAAGNTFSPLHKTQCSENWPKLTSFTASKKSA